MVVEQEVLPYLTWLTTGGASDWTSLQGALVRFGLAVGAISVLALVISYIVLLVRYGPLKAGDITYRTVVGGIGELMRLSPRRIYALARLAVKESLRRRVLITLLIFALILVFASWFLKSNNPQPARLYLSFVLTSTTYLILLVSLLLSAFSLPGDFKSKTIYTIVTKPVRAIDIVLGRILGFTAIGTLLLAIMGLASYWFVIGSLSHTHQIDEATVEKIAGPDGKSLGQTARTSNDLYHSHSVEVNPDGVGFALEDRGHEHDKNLLRARVPQLGKIRFLDRNGQPADRGISVGAEWGYRSFIEGGTLATAIWTFDGINESLLRDDALPIELTVRVYRSYKGDINAPIQGTIQLVNPKTELKSNPIYFGAKDVKIDSFNFPRTLNDVAGNEIDLLKDLVADGRIEVRVQCIDRAQYYGFAQADAYIRLPDGVPWWNFAKAYVSIWVQMVLVIAVGVTASTLLSGPVAMMFTVSFLLLGLFRDFFAGVAFGVNAEGDKVYGGGPVESLVRLVTQKNVMTPFDDSPAVRIMQGIDSVAEGAMQALTYVLPDFSRFSRENYVADGFQIPTSATLQDLTTCAAYVVGLAIAGYFFLRTREVAK